jgi:hypothetical protein
MQLKDGYAVIASDGTRCGSAAQALRHTAVHHAQSMLAGDVVGVARQIEAYIGQSAAHAEAMRLAIRGAGGDLSLESVTALAESIRAYLAEPSPSVPSDQQPQSSASQSAA